MSDLIDRATAEARAFLAARPAPDLTGAVMASIAGLEPLPEPGRKGRLARLLRALWAPRDLTIRPLVGLAGVAAVLALALLPTVVRRPVPSVVSSDAGAAQVFVQFRLETDAARVQLAGSFTNWEPRYEMRQAVPGIWTITVPLTQGVHDYAFVVDGDMWVPDPYAPQIGDGFGGTNSRLALLAPGAPDL